MTIKIAVDNLQIQHVNVGFSGYSQVKGDTQPLFHDSQATVRFSPSVRYNNPPNFPQPYAVEWDELYIEMPTVVDGVSDFGLTRPGKLVLAVEAETTAANGFAWLDDVYNWKPEPAEVEPTWTGMQLYTLPSQRTWQKLESGNVLYWCKTLFTTVTSDKFVSSSTKGGITLRLSRYRENTPSTLKWHTYGTESAAYVITLSITLTMMGTVGRYNREVELAESPWLFKDSDPESGFEIV